MEDKFKLTEKHLYNYKDIDKLNKLTDIKIKQLLNDVSVKAISYEEKSAPTNAFYSSVEDDVIRRDEHIRSKIDQLRKEKENRIIEKELIDNALELLDIEERKLVELRYFKDKLSWTSIALKLNVSQDTCIRMRRKIIYELSNWIN
ncbi:xanthine dehydrogenase [Clostridium butyricum]|uniref:xanthine dehydrogenase n=1 Tax=Clostridium butyricum TaxID=1492 RepID=UPI0013697B23|nr:xanthine dehydrogenase [Clostridium butyricum]MCQ2016789.1 xanthine dehydrogenase [Clostridium butyricum]MCQ2022604.1 xanthine dehydrogenase [Clostridium butyricum]MZI80686.1 xanthine dehydrogenase [Clostridium butyricum]NFB69557.1 xanthine dehydrogenase [Clostridium butyricum]NFB90388.1 xanthine dehydrogenase [Clostridium butyricum]